MGKTALDAHRAPAPFWMNPDDLVVVTDPTHPLYDIRVTWKLREEMVQSIMEHGVLEPIEVRKNDKTVEVARGRRRVLHLREANRRIVAAGGAPLEVRCIVWQGSDIAAAARNAASNISEPETPLSRAHKAVHLMNMGRSDEAAAKDVGCSVAHLRANLLPLLDLAPAVQQAIETGKMRSSAALVLKDKPHEEQVQRLEEALAALPQDAVVEVEPVEEQPASPVAVADAAEPAAPAAPVAPKKARRVTAKKIHAAAGETVAPGKYLLKKVAAALFDGDKDIAMAIYWAIGESSLDSQGVPPCIRKAVKHIEAEKTEKAEKKAERKAARAAKTATPKTPKAKGTGKRGRKAAK